MNSSRISESVFLFGFSGVGKKPWSGPSLVSHSPHDAYSIDNENPFYQDSINRLLIPAKLPSYASLPSRVCVGSHGKK